MLCPRPAQPKTSGSPTLMSGTPILVSGFLSSIFRIRSLSSSLTFGLKGGKEEDEGEVVSEGSFLLTSPSPPALGFPQQNMPGQRHTQPPFLQEQEGYPQGTKAERESFPTSRWISFFPEQEIKPSPSGVRGHKHKRNSRGTRGN